MKKNGVSNANATTRRRFCSSRCSRVVAGSSATKRESRKHRVSVRRLRKHHQHKETGEYKLICGYDDAVAVSSEEPGREPQECDDERQHTRKTGNQHFRLIKMADHPTAVQRSVTKVALINSFPMFVSVRPRSTSTESTTASDAWTARACDERGPTCPVECVVREVRLRRGQERTRPDIPTVAPNQLRM